MVKIEKLGVLCHRSLHGMFVCLFRHEFHKKCVDPWLKIKQNCPMCKCSITSSPSNHSTSRPSEPAAAVVVPRAASPVSNRSDDASMINLGHDSVQMSVPAEEGDTISSQASDSVSSQASDSLLLPGPASEELNVDIAPYSPQVEVNVELLPTPEN